MNCGFCAEYCPFDAIKMDHDFDIASYETQCLQSWRNCSRPASYYEEYSSAELRTAKKRSRKAKEAAKAAKARAAAAASRSSCIKAFTDNGRKVSQDFLCDYFVPIVVIIF